MPLLGQLALWVALLVGVWGAVTGFVALPTGRADLAESARRALLALFVALLVALVSLLSALLRQDFNVAYVASYSDRALPAIYRWAAAYAGSEGRLLVWTTAIAMFAAAAQPRDQPVFGASVAAIASVAVGALLFAANPFARLPYTPIDGRGLAAELQDAGMLLFPPVMYVGAAAAVILSCFAVSALSARTNATLARRWNAITWLLVTIGISFGMWWSYRRLGGTGEWIADPVRSQSLPLWLALSAMIHAAPVGDSAWLRKLTLGLTPLPGLLAIWGMFVRSSYSVQLVVAIAMLGALAAVAFTSRWRAIGRARLAADLAHVGVVVIIVALAAQRFSVGGERSLHPGESTTLRAWGGWGGREFQFIYLATSHYPVANRFVSRALVEVRRGGRVVGRMGPEQSQYFDIFGNDIATAVSHAAVLHRPAEDVYATLVSVSGDTDQAVLRFAINPLMPWAWVGCALLVGGGFVAMFRNRGPA